MKQIKVVWICHFSNSLVRSKLNLRINWIKKYFYKLIHVTKTTDVSDFAVWNTNAIQEIEGFRDVELHVIAPYANLVERVQEFEHNGIFYHFFDDESNRIIPSLYKRFVHPKNYPYRMNRRAVSRLISNIAPDIIHLIGAENPQYSLALLDIPPSIPTIVQLQTLMSDPDFKENYPIDEYTYKYRSTIERNILKKADYIGTRAVKYIRIIKEQIKPNAKFLNLILAVGEKINDISVTKHFDFVYFSSDLNKAGDLALEAFGLAYQKNPSITLDIVGGFAPDFKRNLDIIIEKYNISKAVTFEGRLKTHEDVIQQIRKSKVALLPLRIDLTSGTIREAIANGLPVITTDTGIVGTQQLNMKRHSVIIVKKDDCQGLADNMLLLLENTSMAETLKKNAVETLKEKYDNTNIIKEWVEAYKSCLCLK